MRSVLKAFAMAVIAFSCSENLSESPEEPLPSNPAYTAVGVPLGIAVTKNIGPEGGTLSSDDNRFEIEIPAGALSNNTPFGIQAIANEAPGGIGSAYRFTPEGTKFSKPATLKFHYTQEELEGSAPEFLGIAFQASDQAWRTTYDFEYDESSETLLATTSHFTDFSAYERYKLVVARGYEDTIDINGTTILHLMTTYEPYQEEPDIHLPALPRGSLDGEDDLPSLPQWHLSVLQNVGWLINGRTSNVIDGVLRDGGEISGTPTMAGYTAPEKAPPTNPVLITATISGIIKAKDKLILGTNVYIKSEYNFTLHLEYIDDNMCGYVDGHKSSADMDIRVKDDVVAVSNVVNHPAILLDPVADAVGCTMTYERGMIDYGFILSASGTVDKDPSGHAHKMLNIQVKHTVGNATCFLKCPSYDNRFPLNAGGAEFEYIWSFILKDSTQTWRSPTGHLSSKLTSK